MPSPARRPVTSATGCLRLLGVVVVAAAAVACIPGSNEETTSRSELGLPVARARATTTLPPAAPEAPLAPVTTVPATTAPPTTATDMSPGSYVSSGSRLGVGGCELFPSDHAFRADVRGLPVATRSAQTIAAAGSGVTIVPGFSAGIWHGSRAGYPVNVLDARTAERKDVLISLDAVSSSVTDDVPWPVDPRFEGWPGRAWDKHLIVVDSSTCTSWELINVQPPQENVFGAVLNRWYADKVVTIDLSSNALRPGGTVTASGMSMLSGLVRYDEVASGRIGHALAMSFPTIRAGSSTWPARGTDGRSTDPDAPRMGSWLRLRADADLSGLGPQARTVARALQEHGVVVVDSGPYAALSGEPDVRWNDTDLAGLKRLTMADFEVLDTTPMQVSPSSLQIR